MLFRSADLINNTTNDGITLMNYATLPALSSGSCNAINFPSDGLIYYDIDLHSSHWLDFLDILTLHPTELQAEPVNDILSKYIDFFQLPLLIE